MHSEHVGKERSGLLNHDGLKAVLQDRALARAVDEIWNEVGQAFRQAQARLPAEKAMERREISFHEQVKLLGYLCSLLQETEGDIVEIGVWKGRSIAFMSRMCQKKRRVIGVDPQWFPNQPGELGFYHERIFPEVTLVCGFSELVIAQVQSLKTKAVLLHIDGGHAGYNVLLDFLLYSRIVVNGGFIVFDDYADHQYSPEVGPAVDLLRAAGYFQAFNIIGPVPGFENSYLLQKR